MQIYLFFSKNMSLSQTDISNCIIYSELLSLHVIFTHTLHSWRERERILYYKDQNNLYYDRKELG